MNGTLVLVSERKDVDAQTFARYEHTGLPRGVHVRPSRDYIKLVAPGLACVRPSSTVTSSDPA